MLKIRLQRVGKKHNPSYRVILTDAKQGPKSGKFIEILGSYDAIRKTKQIKADRARYWIASGAQVSDTVHNLFVDEKIIVGKKVNPLPRKTPLKKEAPATPEATAVKPKASAHVAESEKAKETTATPEIPENIEKPAEEILPPKSENVETPPAEIASAELESEQASATEEIATKTTEISS